MKRSRFSEPPLSAILSEFRPLLDKAAIKPDQAAMLTGVLAGSVLIGTLAAGIWVPTLRAV
jgi:uncharacterized protein YejL (UPF0352 family)